MAGLTGSHSEGTWQISTSHHKDFLGPEAAEETTEQQKNVTLRRDFKPSDDEFSTDQF